MKKLLCLALTVALALGFNANVRAEERNGLPEVGQGVEGFTVTERGTLDLTGAPTVLFTHDKTGAQVLWVASQDINRYFGISFRTPTMNDKGIPHVFEHATISGSEKYPSHNLFFPIANRTYNTFVNAMTYDTTTLYPTMSLSEAQLLKLADYYLDGVFNPLILTEERLFRREAWRYELANAEAPIELSGTVYNEMKGAETILSSAMYNVRDALFPGSIIANNAGGLPSEIAKMTWQDLKDFHAAYYHPSNSLTVLYGDIDYAKFLNLIGENYFSKFDAREITVENGLIDARTEAVTETRMFPTEANAITDNASVIDYAFVLNGATREEILAIGFVQAALQHDSSPLQQALRERLPGASTSISMDTYAAPIAYGGFYATGVNEADKDTFKTVVDEAIAQIAKDGFDSGLIDALIAADRFANMSITEDPNMGFAISSNIAVNWAVYGELDYFNDYLDALDTVEAKADDGYLEEVMRKYFIDNKHSALIVTVPEPGKAEENAAALAEELAEVKAAMSADEIEALVTGTADMAEWSMEEAPEELIGQLKAVSVETLPEEIDTFEISDREEAGVRYLTAAADVAAIGTTTLLFNATGVPVDELHYLKLYSELIGYLGTYNYTMADLNILKTRYLNGFSVSTGYTDHVDGYIPVFRVSWDSLNEDFATGAELVKELVCATDVTDTASIKNIVKRLRNNLRQYINENPYVIQYMRAYATEFDDIAYSDYIEFLPYYQFLIDAEAEIDAYPEAFSAKLRSAVEKVFVRDKIVAMYAGNADGITEFEESVGVIFDGMPETEIEAADYQPAPPTSDASEAIVVDSAVQYNLIYDSLEDMGIEDSGKLPPISSIIYDKYLTPQIRHNIGAYDNFSLIDEYGVMFISYRDPSVTETFAVYEGLADFINDVPLTQEDVNDYILSAYSGFAMPRGALASAMEALTLRLNGEPDDKRLQQMKEMKTLTVEDIKALAPAFEALASEGFRSTTGGAAAINANADLYESVVDVSAMNPGAAAEELTFDTLTTLLANGEEGLFETVRAAGFYTGEGFDGVTAETPVTREQFASTILTAFQIPLDETAAPEISDIDAVSPWAVPAVNTIIGYGLMWLDEAGSFNPAAIATTGDYEAMLAVLMGMTAQ